MSDHDNRDRSDRHGSLLSLAPPNAGEAGAEDWRRDDEPVEPAVDRHRQARSRREAPATPLMAALAEARESLRERTRQPDRAPFAEEERELQALLGADAASGEPDAGEPRPGRSAASEAPEARPGMTRGFAARPRAAMSFDGEPQHPRDDDQWRPLLDPSLVVRGVIRSRWIIVAATVSGAVLAALIALSTPKHYVAVAELLIDPRQLRIVQNELTDGGLSAEATLAVVENQVRVLRSGTVLGKVVDTLGLDKDPEFNGTGEGGALSFIPDIRSLLSGSGDEGDVLERRRALAIEHLGDVTDVERGGKTFVVTLTARTEDPDKSALIANTLTEVFLDTYGSIQAGAAGRASDEISARLAELRQGVEEAERKVEAFKSQNDIVDAQGRLITDDEIVKLNDQLTIARARTLELQARADSARSVTVDAALAGNLPEQMNSPVLTEMRTQYSLLRQDADRAGTRLGPRHPERVAVDAQVEAARRRVEQELRLVASSIQVELRRAVQLEQELAARLAQLKARQAGLSEELVTLRELEREATAKRAVYEAFLLRARETGEQRDLNTANMSVISKATPPLQPSGPSRTMMTLLGALLGFGAGTGFGVLRGAFDSLRQERSGTSRPAGPARSPVAASRVSRRRQDDTEDAASRFRRSMAPGAIVGARSEAPVPDQDQDTAATAKETDMYHARSPMGWMPNDGSAPADQQQPRHAAPPYPEPMQGPNGAAREGSWRYPAEMPAGYPAHPQAWGYPQQPAYPHPAMQPYAPVPPQGPAFGQYPPQPQGWSGHPQAPRYEQGGAAQPPYVDPYSGAWSQAPYPGMTEPGYPYHHPQPQPARGPAWQQQGWQQPQREVAPAEQMSSADPEKNAIEEIRDSLREFREALRELAESRSRRRFL